MIDIQQKKSLVTAIESIHNSKKDLKIEVRFNNIIVSFTSVTTELYCLNIADYKTKKTITNRFASKKSDLNTTLNIIENILKGSVEKHNPLQEIY